MLVSEMMKIPSFTVKSITSHDPPPPSYHSHHSHHSHGYGSIPIDTFLVDEHPFTSYFGVH